MQFKGLFSQRCINIDINYKCVHLPYLYRECCSWCTSVSNNEKESIDFLKRVITWINQNVIDIYKVIFCRDFNCQMHTNNNDKSVVVLMITLKTFSFKDCWLSSGKNYKQGLTWSNWDDVPQSRTVPIIYVTWFLKR